MNNRYIVLNVALFAVCGFTVPADERTAQRMVVIRYKDQLATDADADAAIAAMTVLEQQALRNVVAAMDKGLPLALEQAGMYLRQVASCSFAKCHARFTARGADDEAASASRVR